MRHSDSSNSHFTLSLLGCLMEPLGHCKRTETVPGRNSRWAFLVGGMVRIRNNLMRDRRSFDTADLQVGYKSKDKWGNNAQCEIAEDNWQHPGERPGIVRVVFGSGPPHYHRCY